MNKFSKAFWVVALCSIVGSISASQLNKTGDDCSEICIDDQLLQFNAKPEQLPVLAVSNSTFGITGPLSLNAEYSDNFGAMLEAKWQQAFGEDNAIALALEGGADQYRINGTWGHAFSEHQRAKITGEYLAQNMDFDFDSGTVTNWVGQGAVGLTYEYLLESKIVRGLNLNSTYSKADSKDLSTVYFDKEDGRYKNWRRIAGGEDRSLSAGVDLTPTKLTLLGLQLNYDKVTYDTKYNTDNEDESGLGATVNLQQILNKYLKLNLSASDRKPYNDYKAEVTWLASATQNSNLELGVSAEATTGGQDTDSDSKFGVNMSYKWGSEAFDPHASYSIAADSIKTLDNLLNWTGTPAVHMERVLAIKDQKTEKVNNPVINFNGDPLAFTVGVATTYDVTKYVDVGGSTEAFTAVSTSPDLSPFGLKAYINSSGKIIIEGTPVIPPSPSAKSSSYVDQQITMTVTNTASLSGSGAFDLIISSKPTITDTTLDNIQPGETFSARPIGRIYWGQITPESITQISDFQTCFNGPVQLAFSSDKTQIVLTGKVRSDLINNQCVVSNAMKVVGESSGNAVESDPVDVTLNLVHATTGPKLNTDGAQPLAGISGQPLNGTATVIGKVNWGSGSAGSVAITDDSSHCFTASPTFGFSQSTNDGSFWLTIAGGTLGSVNSNCHFKIQATNSLNEKSNVQDEVVAINSTTTPVFVLNTVYSDSSANAEATSAQDLSSQNIGIGVVNWQQQSTSTKKTTVSSTKSVVVADNSWQNCFTSQPEFTLSDVVSEVSSNVTMTAGNIIQTGNPSLKCTFNVKAQNGADFGSTPVTLKIYGATTPPVIYNGFSVGVAAGTTVGTGQADTKPFVIAAVTSWGGSANFDSVAIDTSTQKCFTADAPTLAVDQKTGNITLTKATMLSNLVAGNTCSFDLNVTNQAGTTGKATVTFNIVPSIPVVTLDSSNTYEYPVATDVSSTLKIGGKIVWRGGDSSSQSIVANGTGTCFQSASQIPVSITGCDASGCSFKLSPSSALTTQATPAMCTFNLVTSNDSGKTSTTLPVNLTLNSNSTYQNPTIYQNGSGTDFSVATGTDFNKTPLILAALDWGSAPQGSQNTDETVTNIDNSSCPFTVDFVNNSSDPSGKTGIIRLSGGIPQNLQFYTCKVQVSKKIDGKDGPYSSNTFTANLGVYGSLADYKLTMQDGVATPAGYMQVKSNPGSFNYGTLQFPESSVSYSSLSVYVPQGRDGDPNGCFDQLPNFSTSYNSSTHMLDVTAYPAYAGLLRSSLQPTTCTLNVHAKINGSTAGDIIAPMKVYISGAPQFNPLTTIDVNFTVPNATDLSKSPLPVGVFTSWGGVAGSSGKFTITDGSNPCFDDDGVLPGSSDIVVSGNSIVLKGGKFKSVIGSNPECDFKLRATNDNGQYTEKSVGINRYALNAPNVTGQLNLSQVIGKVFTTNNTLNIAQVDWLDKSAATKNFNVAFDPAQTDCFTTAPQNTWLQFAAPAGQTTISYVLLQGGTLKSTLGVCHIGLIATNAYGQASATTVIPVTLGDFGTVTPTNTPVVKIGDNINMAFGKVKWNDSNCPGGKCSVKWNGGTKDNPYDTFYFFFDNYPYSDVDTDSNDNVILDKTPICATPAAGNQDLALTVTNNFGTSDVVPGFHFIVNPKVPLVKSDEMAVNVTVNESITDANLVSVATMSDDGFNRAQDTGSGSFTCADTSFYTGTGPYANNKLDFNNEFAFTATEQISGSNLSVYGLSMKYVPTDKNSGGNVIVVGTPVLPAVSAATGKPLLFNATLSSKRTDGSGKPLYTRNFTFGLVINTDLVAPQFTLPDVTVKTGTVNAETTSEQQLSSTNSIPLGFVTWNEPTNSFTSKATPKTVTVASKDWKNCFNSSGEVPKFQLTTRDYNNSNIDIVAGTLEKVLSDATCTFTIMANNGANTSQQQVTLQVYQTSQGPQLTAVSPVPKVLRGSIISANSADAPTSDPLHIATVTSWGGTPVNNVTSTDVGNCFVTSPAPTFSIDGSNGYIYVNKGSVLNTLTDTCTFHVTVTNAEGNSSASTAISLQPQDGAPKVYNFTGSRTVLAGSAVYANGNGVTVNWQSSNLGTVTLDKGTCFSTMGTPIQGTAQNGVVSYTFGGQLNNTPGYCTYFVTATNGAYSTQLPITLLVKDSAYNSTGPTIYSQNPAVGSGVITVESAHNFATNPVSFANVDWGSISNDTDTKSVTVDAGCPFQVTVHGGNAQIDSLLLSGGTLSTSSATCTVTAHLTHAGTTTDSAPYTLSVAAGSLTNGLIDSAKGIPGNAITSQNGDNKFGTLTFGSLSGSNLSVIVPVGGDIDNCFMLLPAFSTSGTGDVTLNSGTGILKQNLNLAQCRVDLRAIVGQNTKQDKLILVNIDAGAASNKSH